MTLAMALGPATENAVEPMSVLVRGSAIDRDVRAV